MKSESKQNLKSELIGVLITFFGENISKTLEEYYDEDSPVELIDAAEHMLTGLIGEGSARTLIKKILEKFPDVEKKLAYL